MTYKISVYESPKLLMPWWINFLKSYELFNRADKPIDKPLAKWNGKNILESDYIEFKSEADAILFLLRFS
jgi:hypothetical protein